MMDWKYKGTCWKFGDNLGIDGDVMPLRFALERELDPTILKSHLMTGVDPEFPSKVSTGDIIVAGKRFGQGNPHIQGFLGMIGHNLGLVVESIPRGSFRNAINAGLPFLAGCENVTNLVETGDLLEVDFKTGDFQNLSQKTSHKFEPVDEQLQNIIEAGGWKPNLEKRLSRLSG
ncbi:MAG: 2,3-dimethylmalate dehydratase small subunit [Alphaproteobacteria bacterium MarineAlpha3_Bin7]|nr:MAG: 2,3-dimethylmalate dehydratase small subunit [Alphaproteobacteria bacterium MarineAlpha3_Bin7]|tara:strand:- start:2621 stop:3142 length:522 start_codon:yes stop_codon:yes gene_type:complete